MATSASLKDLSKAVSAFVQSPRLPLPDELNAVITTYLEKHEKSDDSSSEKLDDELISIYEKSIADHPDKYAAFLALLRPLRPAIRAPSRVVQWWDRLVEPVLEHMGREKGLAKEAITNVLGLLSFEVDDSQDGSDAGPNLFADRLLKRWMHLCETVQASGSPSAEFNERVVREAISIFGKKDPKGFMVALDAFFVKKECRNRSLNLLCEFIQSQPPHLHLVLQTPLFNNILQCLQHDDSTTTVSLALVSLIMLLPNMPSSIVPFLPTLFNIYARLLFWDRDRSFAKEHAEWDAEEPGAGHAGGSWEKCVFDNDLDGNSIPYLTGYFTILYGLYPINFVDYIRKPQRYLRHANTADDIDIQAMEIRDRSDRFRKLHLLHPNFYNLTIESEKSDFTRWIKSEAAEVFVECMGLSLETEDKADTQHPAAGGPEPGAGSSFLNEAAAEKEGSHSALLAGSHIGEAPSPLGSQSGNLPRVRSSAELSAAGKSSDLGLSRKGSQSSHLSVSAAAMAEHSEARQREVSADSPTLPAHLTSSSSHTQLEDMMHSNKVIKSGLHQSQANDSVPSLSLSHPESVPERSSAHPLPPPPPPQSSQSEAQPAVVAPPLDSPTQAEARSQLGRYYRQNLLLQIDLSFERYMKQQHMAHVGELRRKQVREAATEAETQNLIMVNRSLKQRLEEAKRGELRIKKEAEVRRSMSKKWEADLSAKLKVLREQQKRWAAEEATLRREAESARAECEELRQRTMDAAEQQLRERQDSEAMDISFEEMARLRAEITRLSESERRYQGMEAKMRAATEEAVAADGRAEALAARLAACEQRLKQAAELYEPQIAALSTQVADLSGHAGRRDEGGDGAGDGTDAARAAFESALAAGRARHAELQKKFSLLSRKYTALQSSLLDMQCDTAERRARSPPPGGDSSSGGGGGGGSGGTPTGAANATSSPVAIRNRPRRGLSDPEASDAMLHNATPPTEQASSSPVSGSVAAAAATDAFAGTRTSSQNERYHGRGGVQNTIRKDRKDASKKEDKPDKKEKKTGSIRGIRGFI